MKRDTLKEVRITFLDLALACAFSIYFDVKPTWGLAGVFAGIYFVLFVVGGVVDAVRKERAK